MSYSERKICWRITRYCNLHCMHCLAGFANTTRTDLASLDRNHAFKAIVECEVTRITWTGGEPTLCADLPALLRLSRINGISNVITTHGLSLKSNVLDAIDKTHDKIRISFDGLEQTHNTIRGGPVFAKALRTFRQVHALGYTVEANISVLDRNVYEIPALVKILADAGASKIVLLNLLDRESATVNAIERPSSLQVEQMKRELSAIQSNRTGLILQHNDYWDVSDTYIVVESDGEIHLCSEHCGDVSFGSICGQSGSDNLQRALIGQTLQHRSPIVAIKKTN